MPLNDEPKPEDLIELLSVVVQPVLKVAIKGSEAEEKEGTWGTDRILFEVSKAVKDGRGLKTDLLFEVYWICKVCLNEW